MEYACYYSSPIGRIKIAGNENSLTGLWFEGQKYISADIFQECNIQDISAFKQAKKWLDIYFDGKAPDFTPPLKLSALSFRMSVWDILLTIPYGKTMTYGEIAAVVSKQRGASKMSAQAVGGAVGHNPISLIVPCHRVIGANGNLTGYAGGIHRKKWLLTHEGVQIKA